MLLLCKKDRAEKLINGTQHKLKLAELNKTVDKIPEDIIENDLSVVQIYLEVDAWLALQQLGKDNILYMNYKNSYTYIYIYIYIYYNIYVTLIYYIYNYNNDYTLL